MMGRRWLLVVLVLCVTRPARAIQQADDGSGPPPDSFSAWVALYDPAQLDWLSNEYLIDDLCGDAADIYACREEMLSPAVSVYDLRRAAAEDAPVVGQLVVVATPGQRLVARYRARGATETTSFEPDLYLADWGYGPYFHHTFLERDGEWFRLPAGPWPDPVWLQRPGEAGRVMAIQAGDAIEMDGAGWTVVGTKPDALLLRPEQPADFWCEEGDPPAAVLAEPRLYTRRDLSDSAGHLRFRLKYLKGC